jgi:tRNA-2-methylthio-N6-dimethylallyladenosine synthase
LEVLCEGPSKTNASRLTGRTRGNKIVLFESNEDCVGRLVDVQIERATGFSLYGTPVTTDARTAAAAA